MDNFSEERKRLFPGKIIKPYFYSEFKDSVVYDCSLVNLQPQKEQKRFILTSKSTMLGGFRATKSLLLSIVVLLLMSECHNVFANPQSAEVTKNEFPINPEFSLPPLRKPERKEPEIMPCSTTRTLLPNEEMQIESPNFSQKMHYPNSLTCEWKFQFPGRMAKLSCPNFMLTEFLCFDSLEVHGANGIMNRYCGSNGPKDLIISEEASITFRTSAFFGNVGFRCTIMGLDEEPETDDSIATLGPTSHCLCGLSNQNKKVVNGIEAQISEFPWQAGLVRKNGTRPFCGGSLINDLYILTAAHCVVGRTPYNLEIILDVHNTEVDQEGIVPIRRSVQAIIPHRRYSSRLDYDAALIKMDKPIDLKHTPPVCLPEWQDLNNSYAAVNATVIGWGLTSENGELSPVLRKAAVNTMSNEECSKKYSSISERMLCAAGNGTDACQGDSGGPLFYESSPGASIISRFTQIGIVSWGIGCARPNKPGVYCRVTEMMKWILKTSSDGSFCNNFPQQFIGSA